MKKVCFFILIAILSIGISFGQIVEEPQTGLDFLTYPIDSRSSALGETGVGTSVDNYSHHANPAKFIFSTREAGVALSYTPWLRNLVNDMSISGITGYYVINSLQSVSASFRYFAMGEMEFRDDHAEYAGNHSPYQLAIDVAYARKLSEFLSASVAFRFALADLYSSDENYKTGNGIAADLSVYYHKPIYLFQTSALLTWGAAINNIGTKVSFYKGGPEYFMPANLRLGGALTSYIGMDNEISFNLELKRSLVPQGGDHADESGIQGIFSSIGEGNFRSFMLGVGAEYGYRDLIFGRIGYYLEDKDFGNRKNLSFGVGLVYKIAGIDVAYIVPTASQYNDAVGNTLRFSLSVEL